jgi:hypothetical protein
LALASKGLVMRTIVSIGRTALFSLGALAALGFVACAPALADTITGRVLGAGAPIADSTVTLWAAGSGGPAQLGQTKTDADGRFTLTVEGKGADLYVAQGGCAPPPPQRAASIPPLRFCPCSEPRRRPTSS